MESYLQAPTFSDATHDLETSLRAPYLTSPIESDKLIFNISRGENDEVAVSELRHNKIWFTSSSVEHGIQASVTFSKPNASEITLFKINSKDSTVAPPLLKIGWNETVYESECGVSSKKIVQKETGRIRTDMIFAKILKGDRTNYCEHVFINRPTTSLAVSIAVKNDELNISVQGKSLKLPISHWKEYESYFKAGIGMQSVGNAIVTFTSLRYYQVCRCSPLDLVDGQFQEGCLDSNSFEGPGIYRSDEIVEECGDKAVAQLKKKVSCCSLTTKQISEISSMGNCSKENEGDIENKCSGECSTAACRLGNKCVCAETFPQLADDCKQDFGVAWPNSVGKVDSELLECDGLQAETSYDGGSFGTWEITGSVAGVISAILAIIVAVMAVLKWRKRKADDRY